MDRRKLVRSPMIVQPHVVLLGAGASLDAFPKGDRLGRRLPLMNDLVDVVGLAPLLERAAIDFKVQKNFEAIYSKLATDPRHRDLLKKMENAVRDYFSSLRITAEATKYDFLLLSLRDKDAIFTFNWDPFLLDAYKRNAHIAPLPNIFFLHGNVRIGICPNHAKIWGEGQLPCPACSSELETVPLLYPIGKKDYSSNRYIRESWEAAKYYFAEAFVLTIFGYGAPASDIDAVDLLRSAWMRRSERKIEHIEIVDIISSSILYERWREFTPTLHLKAIPSIWDSWIMKYPRRSVEGLMKPVYSGEPAETFPLEQSEKLQKLHEQILDIAYWESESGSR